MGRHPEDFRKDAFARRYHTGALPVPEVLALGEWRGWWYAVSILAPGSPLEQCPAGRWPALVGSVADALEALRTAPLGGDGWGTWAPDGTAPQRGWRDALFASVEDHPGLRTRGWRERLGTSAVGDEAFEWGHRLLDEVARDDVPRSLVHADLINRNVQVLDDRITGVFDWGCSMYGDALYDLAWIGFWAPWHPNLDTAALTEACRERWTAAGARRDRVAERILACHLHIGLDSLGYNAHLGDWAMVEAVAARMHDLAGGTA